MGEAACMRGYRRCIGNLCTFHLNFAANLKLLHNIKCIFNPHLILSSFPVSGTILHYPISSLQQSYEVDYIGSFPVTDEETEARRG